MVLSEEKQLPHNLFFFVFLEFKNKSNRKHQSIKRGGVLNAHSVIIVVSLCHSFLQKSSI